MRYILPKSLVIGLLSTWILSSNGNPVSLDIAKTLPLSPESGLDRRAGGGGKGGGRGGGHSEGPDSPNVNPGGGAGEQNGEEGGFSGTPEAEPEGGFTNTCNKKRGWPLRLFSPRAGCLEDTPTGGQPNQPEGQPSQPDGQHSSESPDLPDDRQWKELNIQERFQVPGKLAIDRLDRVKEEPPQPPNAPTKEAMESKYNVKVFKQKDNDNENGNTKILKEVKQLPDRNDWYRFEVRNRDDNVDKFIASKLEQMNTDPNLLPWDKQSVKAEIDRLSTELREEPMLQHWSNIEYKTIVLDNSFNNRYDLFKDHFVFDREYAYKYFRYGIDQNEAVRFTDQVMYGWKQACERAEKDPKDVGLENIVRKGIVNQDTNDVIAAAMLKSGRLFKSTKDSVEFKKGEEGFDAIMGTIHGKRVAQMLTDYHDVVGDLTISKFTITRGENAKEFEPGEFDLDHDMLISLEKIL